jgi:competence protein ComEC
MRHLLAVVFLAGCASSGPQPAVPVVPIVVAPVEQPASVVPPANIVPVPERPAFTVHVVDVGTGLGVLVEGTDFTLVYDAGSNDDTAIGEKNRFTAYLHAVKPTLAKIEHVVLSHPHRDHVELLADVIAGPAVANVWDPGAINPICGYRRFIDAIAHAPGIAYHSGAHDAGSHPLTFTKVVCSLPAAVTIQHGSKVVEGVPIALGQNAKMMFLHVDAARHGDNYNENSLVTLLDLDGTKVLLMGDAEAGGRADPIKPPTAKSVEGYVLGNYKELIDADVLVVGHHGSKSSSRKAFVDAVSPKVSVISAGPTKYQTVVPPDLEVVAELEHAGEVFRTDINDAACGKNKNKIGPDNDNNPGGCDNVRLHIKDGKVQPSYARIAD